MKRSKPAKAKKVYLDVKLTASERRRLEAAAALCGKSPEKFAREVLLGAARAALGED